MKHLLLAWFLFSLISIAWLLITGQRPWAPLQKGDDARALGLCFFYGYGLTLYPLHQMIGDYK